MGFTGVLNGKGGGAGPGGNMNGGRRFELAGRFGADVGKPGGAKCCISSVKGAKEPSGGF
jgi:hypothetical protein